MCTGGSAARSSSSVHSIATSGSTSARLSTSSIWLTGMISTLSGTAVRRDVAMTGEVTLRGRVLPIGGLKEKLLAALRGGITTVLIPAENEKDLVEIPAAVKEGLEIVPVQHIDEVLSRALVEPLQAIEWTDADEHAAEPPAHGSSPESGVPIRH